MNINEVSDALAGVLAPMAPYLGSAATKAAEELGKGVGAEAVSRARELWRRLLKSGDRQSSLSEIAGGLALEPNHNRLKIRLSCELEAVLEHNRELLKECMEYLEASQGLVKQPVSVRSVTADSILGSTVITGDISIASRDKPGN